MRLFAALLISAFAGLAQNSQPSVQYKQDPEYTAFAKEAKITGTVVLSVVIAENGTATRISVVKSLDPGLDQKAIESVQTWVFRPALRDGEPVAMRATIEVNFRMP